MPALVIPDTVRVNLIWSLSGAEYAVNVLHYIVPSGQVVGGATATDLAADIGGAFVASALDSWIATVVRLARLTVRDLRTANQPEYSAVIDEPGLDSTVPLPLQTSLVATFRTALAGRSYRGRYYQCGFAEQANVLPGVADSTTVTDLETFLTNISSPTVQTNLWALGVMSPTLGETNAVTAIEVRDTVWDTQRRRSYPGI